MVQLHIISFNLIHLIIKNYETGMDEETTIIQTPDVIHPTVSIPHSSINMINKDEGVFRAGN
jgi:hypothetical protein